MLKRSRLNSTKKGNRHMKKLLAFLLTAGLLCCCLPAMALDREAWLSPYQYYYQQLSPEHKAAWERDVENALGYPRQTKQTKDRRNQALASMIKTDNPRIFWIDWIDSNALLRYDTGANAHYDGMVMADGNTLEMHQLQFALGIRAAVGEIEKGLPRNADRKTIVKAVYSWLCKNNTYNNRQTSDFKKNSDPLAFAYQAAHSAYSAILPGDSYEPVCEGYACAFKVLCDALGVPCISVNGSNTYANYHMWNCVQLENGGWYLVDVTNGDALGSQAFCLMNAAAAKKYKYTHAPYMNSGVNPSNGYTEGAAFTVPELAVK